MEIVNVTDEIIEINVTEAVVNIVTQDGAYPLPSNVFSVFGRVGNVVGQAGDYTTSLVAEGSNLYYTQTRFDNAFGGKTTTDLTEGSNKYYTDARSRAAISETITGINYDSASGIFSMASGYVIPTEASLDAKVPYTGATGDVNLGEHQLSAGQITFDQSPTGAAGVGVMRWNNSDGTLDLGLKGGNVTLQIGQETLYEVRNETGSIILNGTSVYANGVTAGSGRITAAPFVADGNTREVRYLGLATEDISNGVNGFVTYFGYVRNLDTRGTAVSSISVGDENWSVGDILYAHPTAQGKLTNVKPEHEIIVAIIITRHQNNGVLFVRPSSFGHLEDLHDVSITDPKIDGQGLFLETISGNQLWRNKTIAEVLGYTPVAPTRTISTTAPLTGGGDLSADRTLSMPAATTSASGYLTSTDWNTFNGKQPLIAAGTTAQYYRGDKTFQTLDTLAVPENTNLYYTAARFNTAFSDKTTTDLAEGTNLYFTTARAQAAISGTAPISVASGVVSISQATGSSNGYLSSTDWNTFNSKQAALNGTGFVKISGTTISYDNSTYLTTIEGITAGGELSGTYASPSLVNSAVTGKILSGVNITGGTISDTDSILTAFGKLQNQVNGLIGGSIYKGTWNASTNTPSLASGVGAKGDYYIVSVAGTTNLDGITDWNVGDWAIYDGTAWQQVDNTDAVVSVNGETGAVSLTTTNITEGTNLYFTNARSIASTLTGYTSGAGTISSSDTILSAIQKLNGNVSGLVTGVSSVFGRTGAVVAASGDYTTTQVTEGTNLYYTEARVSANTDVAANTAARHAAVTLGTANGLSLSTQQLSLGLASGSTTGALSSTDWNTFNNKQAALTFGNITSADSGSMTISGGTNAIIGSGVTITLLNASATNAGIVTTSTQTFAGNKTFSGTLDGTSANFSGNVVVGGSATSRKLQINTSGNDGIRILTSGDNPTLDLMQTAAANAGARNWRIVTNWEGWGTMDFQSGTNNTNDPSTTRLSLSGTTGAATFSSSVTAKSSIAVSNNGAEAPILSATSTFADGYRATLRLSNTHTGGKQWDLYSTNNSDGGYSGGKLAFVNSTDSITAMVMTSGGNVGIGTSSPNHLLSLSATASNATVIGFYNTFNDAGNRNWGIATNQIAFGDFHIMQSNAKDGNPISAGTSRLMITSGGNVGIGMSGYGDMRLVVRGATSNSSNFGLRIEDSSANATFQVRNDGFIETGTRSVSPYNNSTSGRTMVIESSGGLGYTSSTRESKTNIEQLSDVSWLYQLNPVSFNYRKKDDEMKYTNEFNEEKWYGLIADEVEKVNEDLVFYNTKEDGTKELAGVEYNKLIAALIKSSQEQQAQIEELKAKM